MRIYNCNIRFSIVFCIIVINLLSSDVALAKIKDEGSCIGESGSGYNHATYGRADCRQSVDGVIYSVETNKYGAILRSKKETIYMGKNCEAISPMYGKGNWEWANAGFQIIFRKKTIFFPRQPDPIENLACAK